MAKKILQIIETAYRATIEEQDDPIIWVAHAMQNNGGNSTVLLRANAVNYGVRAQKVSGLSFGAWQQTEPPRIAEDLAKLRDKGVAIYVVTEDAAERGLESGEMIDGLKSIGRAELPRLFEAHDLVWHW